jgi:hypothetical protein
MGVTSWIRRQFKDAVVSNATLQASLLPGTTTTFTLNPGQGVTFPDGSVGPFVTTHDQGLSTEEKVLVQSRTGDVFTIASGGRGYNGTTPQTHQAGASVLHTIDAQDLDEANQVAVQTLGAIAASGDLLMGSGANALVKLPRGLSSQLLQTIGTTLQWTSFGTGQSTQVGTAASDGTQTTPARSDHTHSGLGLSIQVTGVANATRYVGATTSGAPSSGTFAVGDFVIDQTGTVWICTVLGTPGTWVSPSVQTVCQVYRNAGFGVSVIGNVALDTVLVDTASGWNNTTHKYTVPVAGFYQVSGACTTLIGPGNDGAFTGAFIYQNAGNVKSGGVISAASGGGGNYTSNVAGLLHCAVNDTIELQASASVSSTGITGASYTYLDIVKVSS